MKTWKGLAHIALFTDDLDKTIRFYESLGGECTARSQVQKPQWINQLALVKLAGFTMEIIQPGGGDPVRPENNAWGHIAIEVDSLEDAMVELKACGVDNFLSDINELPEVFGGVRNVYFTGPCGEQIELMQKM